MTTWTRDATVLAVVDGDTVKLDIDLGHVTRKRHPELDLGWHIRIDDAGHARLASLVRVDGINAAEHGTPAGDAATAYARGLLSIGAAVTLVSKRLLGSNEKYGRVLGDVVRSDGVDLATAMLAAGHALPWDGSGARP